MPITLEDIQVAAKRIRSHLRVTPMEPSAALTELTGHPVYLKLEHHQHTGSFKFRGATNAVLNLAPGDRERGVVCVSTGNHGRGLAYAASRAGVRCTICMSNLVPNNKLDAIRALGADVRIVGSSQDEAQVEVDRLVAEEGMTMLPPFDHADIIAGQGTLGLEAFRQAPDIRVALVQVSGGGLISGTALALKSMNPDIRVIGVSMERGAAMHASQEAGKPVQVEELPTLADSLGGGIGLDNRHTFPMVRELVDEIVLLTEEEIAAGIRHAYWQERQIIEGSGGVGIGAILARKYSPDGPALLLLSGGNIDMSLHHRVVSGEDVDVTRE